MNFDSNFSGVKKAERRGNVEVRKMNQETVVEEKPQQEEETSFYWPPDKEIMLGSRFSNVRVYMTEHKQEAGGEKQVQRWLDTRMVGYLKLVVVQDVGAPIVNLRLFGADAVGAERGLILEYELPTNFKYQSLNENFCSLQIQRGEFLGFLFSHAIDKQAFCGDLRVVSKKLAINNKNLDQVRAIAKKRLDEEIDKQIN